MSRSRLSSLDELNARVASCNLCPRLRAHCEKIAAVKRRAYRDWDYWGKPVPGFGDPDAELVLIGLAPAAHGANRTGRMFTGDRSGDFLFAALHRAGFATQPTSEKRGDGLVLKNCYITASLRCAPPDNKPTKDEIENCRPFLAEELKILKRTRVILALGKIAFDGYLDFLVESSALASAKGYEFKHGALHVLPGALPALAVTYHPSQQNTQTGKLTPGMMDAALERVRKHLRGVT